jgi:hypothetical protein
LLPLIKRTSDPAALAPGAQSRQFQNIQCMNAPIASLRDYFLIQLILDIGSFSSYYSLNSFSPSMSSYYLYYFTVLYFSTLDFIAASTLGRWLSFSLLYPRCDTRELGCVLLEVYKFYLQIKNPGVLGNRNMIKEIYFLHGFKFKTLLPTEVSPMF